MYDDLTMPKLNSIWDTSLPCQYAFDGLNVAFISPAHFSIFNSTSTVFNTSNFKKKKQFCNILSLVFIATQAQAQSRKKDKFWSLCLCFPQAQAQA